MPRSDLTRPLSTWGGAPKDGASGTKARLQFSVLPMGIGLLVLILSGGCGKPAESAEASELAEPDHAWEQARSAEVTERAGSAKASERVDAPANAAPDWSHAFASPNALGKAVLHAIEADDASELAALRVTRDEYETFLWSELSVRNGGVPLDFVWQMNNDNSRMGLRAVLEEFGGQEFEFIGVRFSEPPEHYSDFTLYFGAQLWVRRGSDGKEGVLPALSVLVERRGLWKLLNIPE